MGPDIFNALLSIESAILEANKIADRRNTLAENRNQLIREGILAVLNAAGIIVGQTCGEHIAVKLDALFDDTLESTGEYID